MLFLCRPKCSACRKVKAFSAQAGISCELRFMQADREETLR